MKRNIPKVFLSCLVVVILLFNMVGCSLYGFEINAADYPNLVALGSAFTSNFGQTMDNWRNDLNSLSELQLSQAVNSAVKSFVEGDATDSNGKLFSEYSEAEIASFLGDLSNTWAQLGLDKEYNFKIFETGEAGALNRTTVAHLIVNLRPLDAMQRSIFYQYLLANTDDDFYASLTSEQKNYFDITVSVIRDIFQEQLSVTNSESTLNRYALIAELGRRPVSGDVINSVFNGNDFTFNEELLAQIVNDEMLTILFPDQSAEERDTVVSSAKTELREMYKNDISEELKNTLRSELSKISYAIKTGGGNGNGNNDPKPTETPTPTPTPTATPSNDKTIDIVNVPEEIPSPELTEAKTSDQAFDVSVEVKIQKDETATQSVDTVLQTVFEDSNSPSYLPFDISIYIKNTMQKIQPNNGTSVSFTVPVPSSMLETRTSIVVISLTENLSFEIIPSTLTDVKGVPCIQFNAKHFSPYAFVVDPDNQLENYSKTTIHEKYISGYPDGTFQPNGEMNRAETIAMLARLTEGFDQTKQYTSAFSDIDADSWYANSVGFMQDKNIISGYPNGTFKPDGTITRAEFAKTIALFANLPISETVESTFSDVSSSHWAAKYIEAAKYAGYIDGYGDGTFRPDANITRAEAVKVVNASINRTPVKEKVDTLLTNGTYQNNFSDVNRTHWAFYEIIEASNTHQVSEFHN